LLFPCHKLPYICTVDDRISGDFPATKHRTYAPFMTVFSGDFPATNYRTYAPWMTVFLVISLPQNTVHMHRV